jgi:hypothetical protein
VFSFSDGTWAQGFPYISSCSATELHLQPTTSYLSKNLKKNFKTFLIQMLL